jgi:hypothetical protein
MFGFFLAAAEGLDDFAADPRWAGLGAALFGLGFGALDKALTAFPDFFVERLEGLLSFFAAFLVKADIQTPSSRSTRGGMVYEFWGNVPLGPFEPTS